MIKCGLSGGEWTSAPQIEDRCTMLYLLHEMIKTSHYVFFICGEHNVAMLQRSI